MAYIKLDRKYFKNFLWNEARVYSKAEAWLDLIQMARIEASAEFVNGKLIEVQRGEIPASRRFLELRWQWGSSKVSNFLKLLVSQGMITTKQTSGQTVIRLCKYRDYNDSQTTDKPPTNHQQTTNKPPTNQNKEREESKELKNNSSVGENYFSPPAPNSQFSENKKSVKSENEQRKKVAQKKEKKSITKRAEEFKLDIWQIAKDTEYAKHKDELLNFWEYWSEHSTDDFKMRFEKEKSFGIKRRLGTWFKRAEEFNKQKNNGHPFTDYKQKNSNYDKF